MGLPRLKLLGKRFGKLTVSKEAGVNKWNQTLWDCTCDCGNTTTTIGSQLTNGQSKSCGCLQLENLLLGGFATVLPEGMAAFNSIVQNYRKAALRRGYRWEITDEECKVLFDANCFYCGGLPTNTRKMHSGNYTYNGIDRVDNTKGYTIDNCVSCCKTCNLAKGTMGVEEFIKWARQVAYHNAYL